MVLASKDCPWPPRRGFGVLREREKALRAEGAGAMEGILWLLAGKIRMEMEGL